MSNRIKIAATAGFAILVILCIIFFALKSQPDTPEHSIKIIEEAITKHDNATFEKYVNVDNLLNSSYDSFVEGMIEFDKTMPEEVKNSISNFTQMLKVPMMASMKTAIENYVATGNFEESEKTTSEKNTSDENLMAISEILDRAGINKIEFRQIDNVEVDKDDDNKAIAEVRVFQKESAKEFTFEVLLQKNDEGEWRVESVKNFRNFINMINQTRREQLDKYLDETAEIITRHDKTIREAEQKYGSILSIGSLGQDDTRVDLKTLITDVVKKDWEVRKQELFNVNVPKGAETLQNLRIKICDLSIESADLYAKWMSDKKAATIKDADEKHKQVQTLLEEEKILINRISK